MTCAELYMRCAHIYDAHILVYDVHILVYVRTTCTLSLGPNTATIIAIVMSIAGVLVAIGAVSVTLWCCHKKR